MRTLMTPLGRAALEAEAFDVNMPPTMGRVADRLAEIGHTLRVAIRDSADNETLERIESKIDRLRLALDAWTIMESEVAQSNEVVDLLRRAREIIVNRRHYARSPAEAASWTALGALVSAAVSGGPIDEARKALEDETVGADLVLFDEIRGHAEVIALYDRTIARLGAT